MGLNNFARQVACFAVRVALMGGAVCTAGSAYAQQPQQLPDIYVNASRIGSATGPASADFGIVGASTTVITRDEIERAPQSTVAEILSREAGIQTASFYNGVGGAGTSVDLRGFGVTGVSNTLILINGRRLNDWDQVGADLSAIPRNSIERIEITRGNSGAVLYGDGAVGGVINIVTKKDMQQGVSGRIETGFGSFRSREANVSVAAGSGPWSASMYANGLRSDGYRDNNDVHRFNGVGEIRYTGQEGSAFFNAAGDDLRLRTPGQRYYAPTFALLEPILDPRGTATPFDYGNKQAINLTTGVTRMFAPGLELVVDGGWRQKNTQFYTADSTGSPYGYNDTVLSAGSLTPRVNWQTAFFGLPSKVLTGVDYYRTDYSSKRSAYVGAPVRHNYLLNNDSVAGYWQQTVALLPSTDVSAGGRVQHDSLDARDDFNSAAPFRAGFQGSVGSPYSQDQTNTAYHLGFEHRFNPVFAVFARTAKSFRVPNVDDRVGMSSVNSPTNFTLKTQRSHDAEGGVRLTYGPFMLQSSYYDMRLTDEISFSPVTFANINLDPTWRRGVETLATWQVNDALRLKGNVTHTRATYREGQFAGKDVPMVARWTANGTASVNVWERYLMIDATVRYRSQRYADQDNNNIAYYPVPAVTLFDMRIAGEVKNFFWSVAIENLFNKWYFDYAIDQSTPPDPFVPVYTLPGRTFVAKAGVTW